MDVFRITLTEYSKSLIASGQAARWNSKGNFMIYTAASRALACLENLVHRSSFGSNMQFKIMVIDIPSNVSTQVIEEEQLPEHWREFTSYPQCQYIGNDWLKEQKSALLRIPSTLITQEYNYLINPSHPDFKLIKLKATENFAFDTRLKNS